MDDLQSELLFHQFLYRDLGIKLVKPLGFEEEETSICVATVRFWEETNTAWKGAFEGRNEGNNTRRYFKRRVPTAAPEFVSFEFAARTREIFL